jgi:hypothetical protein
MKVSEAYPSKYVSAADLKGENKIVTMTVVDMEKIGDDMKPVLYFRGTEKGLVLNKTNANKIAEIYGDDTEDWRDQQVVLFPTMTDYQGKSVEAVRVRQIMPKDKPRRDPISSGPQNIIPEGGDEIPF